MDAIFPSTLRVKKYANKSENEFVFETPGYNVALYYIWRIIDKRFFNRSIFSLFYTLKDLSQSVYVIDIHFYMNIDKSQLLFFNVFSKMMIDYKNEK